VTALFFDANEGMPRFTAVVNAMRHTLNKKVPQLIKAVARLA
jgi:hypothetical protein